LKQDLRIVSLCAAIYWRCSELYHRHSSTVHPWSRPLFRTLCERWAHW